MTFSILRQVAAEIGAELRSFLGNRVKAERLRGLHLTFDPYWMTWARYRFGEFWGGHWWPPEFSRDLRNLITSLPPDWDRHCWNSGYGKESGPILIRIIFREPEDAQQFGDLPHQYQSYPILYESRPPALGMSISNAADSVGKVSPDTAGTLGGFLRDVSTGTDYIVSCAHVLGDSGTTVFTPGPADKKACQSVGKVRFSQLVAPNTLPSCNARTHSRNDCLDVALAETDLSVYAQTSYPGVAKPQSITAFDVMTTGDHLTFFGKKGRRVDCEANSLCIFHELEIDGQRRCFGDIFTVIWRKPYYVNSMVAKPGDSGAWLLRLTGHIVTWDGLIVACDGATAYACFAENIIGAARAKISGIALVP